MIESNKMFLIKDALSGTYLRRHWRGNWFGPLVDARLYKAREAAQEMIVSRKEEWLERAPCVPIVVTVNVTIEELT